jgi:hypothetical protein
MRLEILVKVVPVLANAAVNSLRWNATETASASEMAGLFQTTPTYDPFSLDIRQRHNPSKFLPAKIISTFF